MKLRFIHVVLAIAVAATGFVVSGAGGSDILDYTPSTEPIPAGSVNPTGITPNPAVKTEESKKK